MSHPVQRVLVSGASSGIGAATARALGREGKEVILVARGATALESVAKEVNAAGGRAHVVPVDASDGFAVDAMARDVFERIGAPDALVHSAGAGTWKFLEETPAGEADAYLDAPFFAALHLTRAFLPSMVERGRGVVVHVNSPAERMPWPGATGYAAARSALRGLHEALAQDLAGTGVSSCHVVFGKVSSAYFENNPGAEERIPKIGALVPTVTPEACAAVLLDVLARPRREVRHPFMLKVLYATHAVLPGFVRWSLRATGASRAGVRPAPLAPPGAGAAATVRPPALMEPPATAGGAARPAARRAP